MDLKDLVVLEYQTNACDIILNDVKTTKKKQTGLDIDLEKDVWSWQIYKNIKIGNSRNIFDSHGQRYSGIIGVYDKTNLNHLRAMLFESQKLTTSFCYDNED